MRHHQGRDLQLLDYIRDREGFARARGAQQHLVSVTFFNTLHELTDRFRLVAGGLVGSVEFKFHGDNYKAREDGKDSLQRL